MSDFLAGLVTGAVPCAAVAIVMLGVVRRLRRKPVNADYRERWLLAVDLLGEEGRLTDEQVAMLKGEEPEVAAPVAAAPPASPSEAALAALHDMTSSDRRALEVQRAAGSLPPVDDLRDMTSSDKKAVLAARAKYWTG